MGDIPTTSPLLSPAWIAHLPPGVARAVGVAVAPAPQRALFDRTPARVEVDVAVAVDTQLPPPAAQLLRLMATNDAWVPGEVRRDSRAEIAITCRCGGARVVLDLEDLAAPIDAIVRRLFAGLFAGEGLAGCADALARGVVRLGALQVLAQHLLEAADADEALALLLVGLCAPDGLGFARAMVFVHDEIRRRFVGARAIGADDADEARLLAGLGESQARALAQVLGGDAPRPESRLQRRVFGVEVAAGDGDEVSVAIEGRQPILGEAPVRSAALAPLVGDEPFLVGAIQPRDRPLALIVVDKRFTGAAIDDDERAAFAAFLGQTALVLDNLSLLRHVERLARHDPLTGALSRREFEARMKIEEARTLRAKRPCALLMIDLDHFNAVNDRRGHPAGDAVLRELGELLRESLRAPDLIGRFSGDAFIVLLPETGEDEALLVAARIGKLAWEHEIALSIGGATYPSDAEVPSGLFSVADRNLRHAKESGRGRACVGASQRTIGLGGAS